MSAFSWSTRSYIASYALAVQHPDLLKELNSGICSRLYRGSKYDVGYSLIKDFCKIWAERTKGSVGFTFRSKVLIIRSELHFWPQHNLGSYA